MLLSISFISVTRHIVFEEIQQMFCGKRFSHKLSTILMPALQDLIKHYNVKGFASMFNAHGV